MSGLKHLRWEFVRDFPLELGILGKKQLTHPIFANRLQHAAAHTATTLPARHSRRELRLFAYRRDPSVAAPGAKVNAESR